METKSVSASGFLCLDSATMGHILTIDNLRRRQVLLIKKKKKRREEASISGGLVLYV